MSQLAQFHAVASGLLVIPHYPLIHQPLCHSSRTVLSSRVAVGTPEDPMRRMRSESFSLCTWRGRSPGRGTVKRANRAGWPPPPPSISNAGPSVLPHSAGPCPTLARFACGSARDGEEGQREEGEEGEECCSEVRPGDVRSDDGTHHAG